MLERLILLDHQWFEYFNGVLTHPFLDWIMPLWTQAGLWLPLYVFVGVFILLNYPLKQGGQILLCIILAAGIADFTSSFILKPYFGRLRPCQLPGFSEHIRLLVGCGTGKSFVSGHATNHFALAACWICLFGQRFKWIIPVLLFWAASVAYSRVYIGVHFPMDIFCGSLLGLTVGSLFGLFGRKWANL